MAERDNSSISTCTKWSAFIGIYLVRFFCGVPWVWGNMSTYVQSYFYARRGPEGFSDNGPWLLVSNNIGFNVCILIGSLIGRRIGVITTIFLAMTTYNCSVFISFLTVQHSYPALYITFGLITGMCSGIIEANQYTLIVRWTERYQGMTTSSIPSFNIFGAVAMNLIVTFYINPDNAEANLSDDRTKLFSQPDLIERVPYAFFLYGSISLSLNCVGFLLLRDRPGKDNVAMRIVTTIRNVFSLQRSLEKSRLNETSVEEIQSYQLEDDSSNSNNSSDDSDGLTPKQILKTKEFYALWLFMPVLNYAFVVVNNYYKTFGLLYISDDHFLASVGTLNCLFTPPCTCLAGYIMDRIGVKNTMLGVTSLMCIIASFFYASPLLNRWVFLVWCVAYCCIIFTCFCSMCSCTLKLFGQTYFNTNYGLVMSSTYGMCIATPFIVEYVLSYGWAVLFYSTAVFMFLGVLLMMAGLPRTTPFKTI